MTTINVHDHTTLIKEVTRLARECDRVSLLITGHVSKPWITALAGSYPLFSEHNREIKYQIFQIADEITRIYEYAWTMIC